MKQFSKLFLSAMLFSLTIFSIASAEDSKSGSCMESVCFSDKCYSNATCSDEICDKFSGPLLTYQLPNTHYFNSAAFFNPYLYGCGADPSDRCATAFIGYRYEATQRGCEIARALFGTQKLEFLGSMVKDRVKEETGTGIKKDPTVYKVLADNFGLSPLYKGSVTFDPKIQMHNVDFSFRWEMGGVCDWMCNSWIGVDATLTHARWALNGTESGNTNGNKRPAVCGQTLPESPEKFPAGYMAKEEVEPLKNIQEALMGDKPWGVGKARNYHKINFSKDGYKDTKLASLSLNLGYDFARCECYHTGAFLYVAAPTGTKEDAAYHKNFFYPMVGNGHHWGVGGGLSAHYDLWCCDEQCVSFHIDGKAAHLVRNKKIERPFDLKLSNNQVNALSRFALVKGLKNGEDDDADKLVSDETFEPAINNTLRKFETKFNVEGDLALRFQYNSCGFSGGVGYKIYGRSKEDITAVKGTCDANGKLFGLKGVEGMYDNKVEGDATSYFANNNTQTENADLFGSYNNGTKISPISDKGTCDDAKVFDGAPGDAIAGTKTWDGFDAFAGNPAAVKDLDVKGNPRQVQHTIFGDIAYAWQDCDCEPFMKLGGGFSLYDRKGCAPQTPRMWSIWFQVGAAI